MKGWRFYGRQKELAELRRLFAWRLFSTRRINGGRGVGKTRLLQEAATDRRGDPPLVYCELPRPGNGGAELLLGILERAAADCGDLYARQRQTLRSGPPQIQFCELVDHLIKHGAVVALDEFHNARHLGLESQVKLMIDMIRFANRVSSVNPERCGKLVLMGSHQQQMLRMFQCDQPLHGRVDGGISLRQWSVGTVLEMAAGQGLLAHPRRFLTLWTAYGGMPGHWERFATDDRWEELRDFGAWVDERQWRFAFIAMERNHLEAEPEDRYDNRAFVQLAAPHREALLWLGENQPKGATENEFPPELRQRAIPSLADSLQVLERHLGLVTRRREFPGGRNSRHRWEIADGPAAFQIHVLDLADASGLDRRGRPGLDLGRLETLEGSSLERLCAGVLRAIPGVRWCEHRAWKPVSGAEDAEVDVLAMPEWDSGEAAIFAECKRSAARHKTGSLDAAIERFTQSLQGVANAQVLWRPPPRRVLVSPQFTAADRERHASNGLECLDIGDMARALGIDPDPPVPLQCDPPDKVH